MSEWTWSVEWSPPGTPGRGWRADPARSWPRTRWPTCSTGRRWWSSSRRTPAWRSAPPWGSCIHLRKMFFFIYSEFCLEMVGGLDHVRSICFHNPWYITDAGVPALLQRLYSQCCCSVSIRSKHTREMRRSSRVLFTYFQFACSYLLTSPRSPLSPQPLTCVCNHIAVSTLVLLQCEPRQMEPGHYLDWINILPLVNQVICRPAIWR